MESSKPEAKTPDSDNERGPDPSSDSPTISIDSVEEDEEEEGECGFCLFMKGGGCKESFIAWEKCMEETEKKKEDVVEKCFEVTGALKKCMEAHNDYYGPIISAEKRAEEEALNQLEKEKLKAGQ